MHRKINEGTCNLKNYAIWFDYLVYHIENTKAEETNYIIVNLQGRN